ncbi:MAG: SNF2-related protein [Comamonas sp.]
MLKIFRKTDRLGGKAWRRQWSVSGAILVQKASEGQGVALATPLLDAYLAQLVDDGLVVEIADGYALSWDSLFDAFARPEYAGLANVLGVPGYTDLRVTLFSNYSLEDADFSIALGDWTGPDGYAVDVRVDGALLEVGYELSLMRPTQWALLKEVRAFARRPVTEHDGLAHRLAWGRIRKLALAADARLTDFLVRSVVLTPETLQIGLRRSDGVANDHVIEIEPRFANVPQDWLDAFDRGREVRDRYDIPTPEGVVQVLITPKVRSVLQEIKRMPGRRVAGSRAQAFMLNPYATLGEDAADVLEEAQFEQAREAAGLDYERFTPVFEHDAFGYPAQVGLLIETASASGFTHSETQWLDDAQLESFVQGLRRAVDREHQLLAWNGYDLAVDGDATRYLESLAAALERRQTPPTLVSYAQVHDLSAYSARVEGIGLEKPYYSPYIAKKKDEDGWFPDNVFPVLVYTPAGSSEPVAVPATREAIEQLERDLKKAEEQGRTTLQVPWLPEPMPIDEARRAVHTFKEVLDDIASGKPPRQVSEPGGAQAERSKEKQLVLRANIQSLEYEEIRRAALQALPVAPKLPHSIRPGFKLLDHQLRGVAWLQHLVSLQAEYQVRGAVLADDMGLGKTFQLLALMTRLLEDDPDIDPMLVVAPVSLLENWAEEVAKFFVDGALPLLTAYGDALARLRVPKAQIDERLRTEDGLVKFLRPGWIGSAKVVLTTYETLRDFEFSFASQKWSLMVCDEAQRIKNPAAMVTRAAKKQNVGFKIACTGTPVENTLADLWCLFDYVQPGLLGALNDFGKRYRKPIEAKTDEEKIRVEELRARVAPQILRRLKTDVATDLPPKIVVEECRRLSLSGVQRNLYTQAIQSFKTRDEPGNVSPFKNHLGLLHYLRLICTDPRRRGLDVFKPEATEVYRSKSPKLDWLLDTLKDIKLKDEKVIIFCEFREIQRLLRYYIKADFGFAPDIINGDTSASSMREDSRQKRIKAFQAAKGFGVLILSPVAVGFGVNIQAANHVVHYTRTWNPAKEDQATDRAYRIGQEKPVYVYYLVVRAKDFTTFDAKLDKLLAYKRRLAEDMLNGAGDVTSGDFDLTDVVPTSYARDLDPRITLDMALRMNGKYFESLIVVLWSLQGFECYRTPATKDNGIDVVALADVAGRLLQVKSSSIEGMKLSWDAVKEVVAGAELYRKRHPAVDFSMACVTNQYFNQQAHENAELNQVELIEQPKLGVLLDRYEVTMTDVERVLYSDALNAVSNRAQSQAVPDR